MKKWYRCDNKLGARLQIGAYKYLKVPYGTVELDEKIAKRFPTLLTEIVEKKVLLVEEPVPVEAVKEEIIEDSTVEVKIVEKEVKPATQKKRSRPKKNSKK